MSRGMASSQRWEQLSYLILVKATIFVTMPLKDDKV